LQVLAGRDTVLTENIPFVLGPTSMDEYKMFAKDFGSHIPLCSVP
jgi:hypothetical protein